MLNRIRNIILIGLICLFLIGCSGLNIKYVNVSIEPSITYTIEAIFSNGIKFPKNTGNYFELLVLPNKKYTLTIYAYDWKTETRMTKKVTYISTKELYQYLTINLEKD